MPVSDTRLPRVFIACAPQDVKYCELIAAKARGDRLPLVFDGFGEGRITEVGWQLECRRRLRSAKAVIVLVSSHTSESPRALWQVQCAREHGIPVVGITVTFDDDAEHRGGVPEGMGSIVGWKWKTIAATLMRFAAAPSREGAEGSIASSAAPGFESSGSAA